MNDEIALADMSHDDVEGAAAELASIMTKVYDQAYRPGDVLDLAAECASGRSADALALGLSTVAAGVREDAAEAGLSFDGLLAEASDNSAVGLSVPASAAGAEAERIIRDARRRGTLNRGGKRRSGPDLVHDFTDAEDGTDDRQPARGGDDWLAEVERIARQHAAEMGSPLDTLESPRGGSTTVRRKSPGEQALGRRRAAGRDRTPLTMASPQPYGSTATEVPVTGAYSGTLTT